MPRNPDLSTYTIQLDPALRKALKGFKRAHELDYDADAVRMILTDRLTAEGFYPPKPADAPPDAAR